MSVEVDNYLAHLGIEVSEEDLAHYGKKGMHWGVTSSAGGAGGSGGGAVKPSRKEKKAAANAEINDARDRQRMREVELERQAFKTYTANGAKAAEAAVKKYDKMQLETVTHPDAATAAKMTSGEKAVAAMNWSIIGGLAVASIALKVATQPRL